MGEKRLIKRLLVWIVELAGSLTLVAISFLIFIGIYSVSFPNATGLGEMIRNRGTASAGDLDFEMEGLEETSFTARLSDVRRTVKDKPADGIVWGNARSGTRLGERHAVQSFARSGATISFGEEGRLELGENSLVVIRDTRRAARSRRRTATVVVLDGELTGQLTPSGAEPLVVEIAGATSTLRIESGATQTTEFKVTTNTDDSSTFAVYNGDARLNSIAGEIQFGPNQFVTIGPDGQVQEPMPLPPAPTAIAPVDDLLLAFRGASPQVGFVWEPQGAHSSRFVLARDKDFQDVVYTMVTTEREFLHGALQPGTYFWRVSGLDGSVESPASASRRFEILRDRKAPALQVLFPDEPIETAALDLTGITEPGTEVFVGDTRVAPDEDGSFVHQIRLQPGMNVVVVEAVDPVGNTSYASSVVHAKFAVPESTP